MHLRKIIISISFKGNGLNTSGIGAKAYVFSDGKMQYQQLMLTRGFQSSSDSTIAFRARFGSAIDSVLIVWPDQKYQVIRNIPGKRQLVAEQKNASGKLDKKIFFPPARQSLLRSIMNVSIWKHKENDFMDVNVQYLIPHGESTRGPKIAVGDVNGDGLDDMYACGANGQAGALLIQQKNG